MALASIDRLVSLFLFHPVKRAIGASSNKRIPILMYHSISEDAEAGKHPYYNVTCSPQAFAQQMRFLRENDYVAITLSEAARHLEGKHAVAAKSVVITFDDGYQDFYTHAFPILSEHGLSATVFLPTNYIGHSARSFNGKKCLTWTQVRELHRAGTTFGSHTASHPQLTVLAPRELNYELQSSKGTLQDALACAVDSFSYPYAFPEQDARFRLRLRHLLVECGYAQGVSTILGVAVGGGDKFFLKRLPVSSRDDDRFLRAKLEGGYDWLHNLQYATKLVKARMV